MLLSLFDVLLIPGAFGHGTWWLLAALLAKTAASMGMASLSLVTRRRWPVVVMAVGLIVWMMGNGIYYHATGLYITYDVLTMAGGLAGFTSSVTSYLKWDVWVLLEDLLEEGGSRMRLIDIESAYELSDKLIRKNYFAKNI